MLWVIENMIRLSSFKKKSSNKRCNLLILSPFTVLQVNSVVKYIIDINKDMTVGMNYSSTVPSSLGPPCGHLESQKMLLSVWAILKPQ